MGIEYTYQALPAGSTLLARALAEPSFGAYLEFPRWWWEVPAWRAKDPDVQAFVREAQALLVAYHGLDRRSCTVDRCWDVLAYLLSDARRRGVCDETDMGTLAIHGAAPLADHLTSTQGFPIRYTPPDDVGLVWLFLEPYTPDTLLASFDPVQIERDTYKGYGYRDEPERVWSSFEALRRCYREAFEHREGMLVIAS